MRRGWQRKWTKLYPIDCLDGSVRYQLEPDERGVWYDLLLFSTICIIPGTIADEDNRPYPHSFIANRLNIPLELLERTLKRCIEQGRLQENEQGIQVTNWTSYQSEYERQKPYRQRWLEKTHHHHNRRDNPHELATLGERATDEAERNIT